MAVIEGATPKPLDVINASNGEDDNDESVNQPGVDNSPDGDPLEQEHLCRVLLIDAMVTLQGIKKEPRSDSNSSS